MNGQICVQKIRLKGYLERMVIDVLIDIEGTEDIQCSGVIDLLRHLGIQRKFGKQMGAVDDGIPMDNAHISVGIVAVGVLQFHNP